MLNFDHWGRVLWQVSPLARGLFRSHAWLIRIDRQRNRYLVEVRNDRLLAVAHRYRSELETALNQSHGLNCRVELFSLSALRELAALAIPEGEDDAP